MMKNSSFHADTGWLLCLAVTTATKTQPFFLQRFPQNRRLVRPECFPGPTARAEWFPVETGPHTPTVPRCDNTDVDKNLLFFLCLLYSKYLSACGFLYGAAEQAASVCLCTRGALLCSHQQPSSVIRRQRYKLTVRYYKLCLHEHKNCSFPSNYCILM